MSGSLPPFTNPIAEHLSSTSAYSSGSSDQRLQHQHNTTSDSFSSGRRGPRPTTEPAANPKRQKNREAQRAHRERKERYVKDLEYDAARLRQYSVQTTRERDAVVEQRDALVRENEQLRGIIESLRMSLRPNARFPQLPPPTFPPQFFLSQAAGISHVSTVVSRTEQVSLDQASQMNRSFTSEESSDSAFTNPGTGTLDYDAIAIDFVLGLERPCMEHIQYLVSRANNPTGQVMQRRPPDVPDDGENEKISGHALMASCPPPAPLKPFVNNKTEYQLPDIERADLTRLLGLSDWLPGVGEDELPPIKAWARLKEDYRFARLSAEDFREIQRQLITSVQCHRFGSVLSAAELEDAVNNVCNTPSMTPSGRSN